MEPASVAFYSTAPTGNRQGVHFSRNVIDRLASDIERSFRSLSGPGAEIGGILLGTAPGNGDAPCITGYRLFPCGYRRGPLYLLSEEEKRRLCDVARTPGAIGFFRSHTRRSMALTEEDLSILRGCFLDSACVCLLVKPFQARPPLAAFFSCDKSAAADQKPDFEFPFRVADFAPDADQAAPVPNSSRRSHAPAPESAAARVETPPRTTERAGGSVTAPETTPPEATPADEPAPASNGVRRSHDPAPESAAPSLPPPPRTTERAGGGVSAPETTGGLDPAPGSFAFIGVHRRQDHKRKVWWLTAAAVILLSGALTAGLYFKEGPPPPTLSNAVVAPPPPAAAPVSEPQTAPNAPPPSRTRQAEPVTPVAAEAQKQHIPPRQIILPPAAKPRDMALPDPPRIDSTLNPGVPVPALSTLRTPAPPAPRPPAAKPEPAALNTNPVVAIATPPVYPPAARSSRAQGTVLVQATVDETGHVRAVAVLGGPALLHQAAAEAVKRYLFYPAARNGIPIEAVTQVEVRFSRPN